MLTLAPAPLRPAPRVTRGFTLSELVVALALSGVAFGVFALVVAQQERSHAEIAHRVRARAQLRDGLAALAADLRSVSPPAGDIPAGEARDSSIEFRAPVGTAVVCELRDRALVAALASFVTPPHPGDSAWAYVDESGRPLWIALAIAGASTQVEPGPRSCPFPPAAASLFDTRRPSPHYLLSLAERPTIELPAGTPLRLTRRVRYSLYRAPDGRWYLGRREWSPVQRRFETIQPVSGPYRPYAGAGGEESGFELRYFDAGGDELSAGSSATNRIARVAITLRTPPPRFDDRVRERRDEASVTVAFRNRS